MRSPHWSGGLSRQFRERQHAALTEPSRARGSVHVTKSRHTRSWSRTPASLRAKIATIAAGERPTELTREEAVAHDLATALNRGTTLPEGILKAGLDAFVEPGLAEIVFLVGCFCRVSVVLNAYDVVVPGRDDP
jgi:hypothetical protein